MLQDDLQKLLPGGKKPALVFLDVLRKLLPFGWIWGFIANSAINLSITKDNINDSTVPAYKDNINNGTVQVIKNSLSPLAATKSKFALFLSVFSNELYLFQERSHALYRESIPGLAVELLPEWEKITGFPNECTINYDLVPIEERQQYVHGQIYSEHSKGLTEQYIVDYALLLGYVIDVTDDVTDPFRVAPNGVDPDDLGSRVGDRLDSTGQSGVQIFKIISGDTDPDKLARFQCQVEKLKPAHVEIIWV